MDFGRRRALRSASDRFFIRLLSTLSALAEGSTHETIRLFDDTYLVFDRTEETVTVAHRYSEAATDEPDELLDIEFETTAPLASFVEEGLAGSEDLLDRISKHGFEDAEKLRRLQSVRQILKRHFE